MPQLLSPDDQTYLTKEFEQLKRDVPITVVTHESSLVVPGEEVPYGREVKEIMTELSALSPKIKLTVEDVRPSDAEKLKQLRVERLPAIILGERARYYGLPAGYEFSTMIAAILDAGADAPPLKPEVAEKLAALKQSVHIQVFVTPT